MLPIVELVSKAIEKAPVQVNHRAQVLPFTYITYDAAVEYFQSLKKNIKEDEMGVFSDVLSIAIDCYPLLMARDPELRNKSANFQNIFLGTGMMSIAAKHLQWVLLDESAENNLMTSFNELVQLGYFKGIAPSDDDKYLVFRHDETLNPSVVFGDLIETNEQVLADNERLQKVAALLKTSYVHARDGFLVFAFSINKSIGPWPSLGYSKTILETAVSVPDEFVGKYVLSALLAAARYAEKISDVIDTGLARSLYANDIFFLPRSVPATEQPNMVVIAPELVVEGDNHICYIDIPGYPEPEAHTIAPR